MIGSKWFPPLAVLAPAAIALAVPREEDYFVGEIVPQTQVADAHQPAWVTTERGYVADYVSAYKRADVGDRLILSLMPLTLGTFGLLGIGLARGRAWKGAPATDAMFLQAQAYLLTRFHIRDGLPIHGAAQAGNARGALILLRECLRILEENRLTEIGEIWTPRRPVHTKKMNEECREWIAILERALAEYEQRRVVQAGFAAAADNQLAAHYALFGLQKGQSYSLEQIQAAFHLAARQTCPPEDADPATISVDFSALQGAFQAVCLDQGHQPAHGAFLDRDAMGILLKS